jgi:hydrogenase large subunit
MPTTISVNPLTRLEGHLDIETSLDGLAGRRKRILRNLILAADFLQSHIFHFYQLAMLDYVNLAGQLNTAPWTPGYKSGDMLTGAKAADLVAHYVTALGIRRKAHEMGAIFGGRLPHSPALVPGGCSQPLPDNASSMRKIAAFRRLWAEVREFIAKVYVPDVHFLSEAFPEYAQIGRGCGNLLAFGVFNLDGAGRKKLFRGGCVTGGQDQPADMTKISEHVKFARYTAASGNLHPAAGATEPAAAKAGAYSWIKAPRDEGLACEVGPLARMWINGDYGRGISVMDRLTARALEARQIADAMAAWLGELRPGKATTARVSYPAAGAGAGLTEAPRGALGHWVQFRDGAIERYQVVTPTAWNASPNDDAGRPGPIEQALVGTPVADPDEPIELLRVVHSFDPCAACAVH